MGITEDAGYPVHRPRRQDPVGGELIYVGVAFLPDVPARDLTAEEAKKYGYERLIASGLYGPKE